MGDAYTNDKAEAVLNTLVESFFLEGSKLQEDCGINARRIVYILLQSDLSIERDAEMEILYWDYDIPYYGDSYHTHNCYLHLPLRLKPKIADNDKEAIKGQLEKILDTPIYLYLRTKLNFEDKWRENTKIRLESENVNNQGNVVATNLPTHVEDGLYFRSKSEISLYRVLKESNIMFMPLPVSIKGSFFKKEPDFFIIYKGKPAIIEVNGSEWHQDLNKDNIRNDVFLKDGIQVFPRSAEECYNNPKKVLATVMAVLDGPNK